MKLKDAISIIENEMESNIKEYNILKNDSSYQRDTNAMFYLKGRIYAFMKVLELIK